MNFIRRKRPSRKDKKKPPDIHPAVNKNNISIMKQISTYHILPP